jgi:hypothetical protein
MGNKNKARGTSFETLIVKYLRSREFKKAYRPSLSGKYDTGDINGIAGPSRQAIIQCKNQRKFDLSGWLNDAVSQAQQEEVGHNALPILVVKRPGIGEAKIGETYAILRLEDLSSLLKEAGYN